MTSEKTAFILFTTRSYALCLQQNMFFLIRLDMYKQHY